MKPNLERWKLEWRKGALGSHCADSMSRRYTITPETDGYFRVWLDRGIPLDRAESLDAGKAIAQAHAERW